MIRELLHHRTYVVFWGIIMLISTGVGAGIWYQLYQIAELLRRRP